MSETPFHEVQGEGVGCSLCPPFITFVAFLKQLLLARRAQVVYCNLLGVRWQCCSWLVPYTTPNASSTSPFATAHTMVFKRDVSNHFAPPFTFAARCANAAFA